MKGLYVYAIAARPVQTRRNGIFRRRLRSVRAGRLHAVVESAARAPKPSLARLKAQSRVLSALVRDGVDLLPARFGTHVDDVTQLEAALRDRSAGLRAALQRTRGCVQMTLRIEAPSSGARRSRPQQVEAGGTRESVSGAAYLRGRASRDRARRSHPAVRGFTAAAEPFIAASLVEWRGNTATVFHLVRRSRLDAYAAALAQEARRRGVPAVLSGPFAPFAFVEIR